MNSDRSAEIVEALGLTDHVRELAEKAPPLTQAQRISIALILSTRERNDE